MEQRLDTLTIHLRSVSSLEIIFLHNCFSCLCFSYGFSYCVCFFSGTGIERTYWSLEKFSCYRTRIMEFGENGNGFLAELTIRIKWWRHVECLSLSQCMSACACVHVCVCCRTWCQRSWAPNGRLCRQPLNHRLQVKYATLKQNQFYLYVSA